MKVPADLYTASLRPYLGLPEIDYPFHDRDIIITNCGRAASVARRSTYRPC